MDTQVDKPEFHNVTKMLEERIEKVKEQRVISEGFGFWIEPGWYTLILELDAKIAAICPNYMLMQAKQKFRGLRYYVEFPEGTDEATMGQVHKLISAAEAKSFRICERCGGHVPSVGNGLGMNYCPPCEEWDNRRFES